MTTCWGMLACIGFMVGWADSALGQATVATDQQDYPPNSTVYITGAGFQPGEIVQLQVLRIDIDENTGPEHDPWTVTANGAGGFETSWHVTPDEVGATLCLTATGQSSSLTAQAVFTDSVVTPATGGEAISADTAGGAYTSLSGPSITETASGDIKAGSIVLNTPPGFEFDTGGVAPDVLMAAGDANPTKNINNVPVGNTMPVASVTTNQITFQITSVSSGQTRNVLAFQNIRVRPTAAAPLASGDITNSGTAVNVPSGTTSYGTLTEVPGAATAYRITAATTTPAPGVANPLTIMAVDQHGNTVAGFSGDRVLTFTGLATSDRGTYPTVTDKTSTAVNLGTPETISFAGGISSSANGAAALKAYKVQTATLNVSDNGGLSSTAPGGAGVTLTVSNANPVALAKTLTRGRDVSLKILKSDLLAGATDANDDNLNVAAVQTTSAGGATVSAPAGSWVFYLPNSLTNGAGNGDTFTYTLSDGNGGTGTGTVTVYLQQQGGMAQQIAYNPGGVTVIFAGIPGYTYDVQRASDLSFTSPTVLTTTQAPPAGVFSCTDSTPPSPGPSFYRLMQH